MIKTEEDRKDSTSSASTVCKKETSDGRGRKQERESSETAKVEETHSADDNKDTPGKENKMERKRKRSRKGLDKKYLCPHEDCGKSYSRAEHLYRHQLNHSPKQIYRCDFPDCGRCFVRQDLCTRHRERHTTRGLHLQRKDNYFVHPDQSNGVPQSHIVADGGGGHGVPHNNLSINTGPFHQQPYEAHSGVLQSPSPEQNAPGNPRTGDQMQPPDTFRQFPSFQSPSSHNPLGPSSGLHRSNSDSQYNGGIGLHGAALHGRDRPYAAEVQRHSSFSSTNSLKFQESAGKRTHMTTVSGRTSESSMHWQVPPRSQQGPVQATMNQVDGLGGFVSQQNFAQLSNLPPPTYPNISQNGPFPPQPLIGNSQDPNGHFDEMTGVVQTESPITDGALSGFDGDGYARSPVVMADNFTTWLFNTAQFPNVASRHQSNVNLDQSFQLSITGTMPEIPPPQTSMAVASLLEPTTKQASLSEAKRQHIIEIIEGRFNETNYSPVAKQKAQLLEGDRDLDGHVLSNRSLQTYIDSYWYRFHEQMPILHRPTFTADKCQPLLLIAIIAIGAANLDKAYGEYVTNLGADLANFLIWHLRSELFMDRDFGPPAKLWVLQSLLLVECYEKMYSSRILHERSHIHHATTISLIRRGSALLGRSGMDSPPTRHEDQLPIVDTGDAWWNHWITHETTKRIAYAAFIIDSSHATMFSHSAVMLAHEMRLPLPCDEALWTASSGMEVGRIEQSLRAEGIKPISFLDGLKWTLYNKPVRTNRFGRTALMAGLLNVSFHLAQRDIQIRTLGVLGDKEPWRGRFTRAFDYWEADWNNEQPPPSSNSRQNRDSPASSYSASTIDEEQLFESRVVLHHLAHMGMHIDIVQCQIYAKAKRLLGRSITPADYDGTVRRMREKWAPSARARDAVFYSLKFLGQVLTPDIIPGVQKPPPFRTGSGEYTPRDDYLLNRPWVLYFAALVVWSYGYALDGPLAPGTVPPLATKEQQVEDMRSYMRRVGGVPTPNELEEMPQRNCCAGMLMFLGGQFKKCRWELMHEASRLLGNCVDMLMGEGR